MTIRTLANRTAIYGTALGLVYGSAALAQVNRPETPPAENRQIENPAGPAAIPSPIDDNTVMPGNAGNTTGGTMDNALPADRLGERTPGAATPGAGVTTSADARELIGAKVKNTQNETIGEVESIYVDPQGGVRSVIVGTGGFLGFGERNVALGWNALNVADDGKTVHTTLSKDDLKAMPEYRYADNSYRGKLFNDSGIVTN